MSLRVHQSAFVDDVTLTMNPTGPVGFTLVSMTTSMSSVGRSVMSAVEDLAGDFGVGGRDKDSDAHFTIDRHGSTLDFIDDLGGNPVADEMGLRDLRFAPIGVGRDHNRFRMQLGVGHVSAVPVGGRLEPPVRPNRIV